MGLTVFERALAREQCERVRQVWSDLAGARVTADRNHARTSCPGTSRKSRRRSRAPGCTVTGWRSGMALGMCAA